MEISKSAVLLANEHRSYQKNATNDFRMNFRHVFVHAKRLCQWNARKCSIREDFNKKKDNLGIS